MTAAADLPGPKGPLPLRLLSFPKTESVEATVETTEITVIDDAEAASSPGQRQDLAKTRFGN